MASCRTIVACIAMVGALAPHIGVAQVSAPPTRAPATLAGVVRDPTGAPLGDVTISLLGETPATRTDSAGRFALAGIEPGRHTALFRRLGYRSAEYRWSAKTGAGLQIAVTMMPLPRELQPVVTEAPGTSRRRGTSSIGGTVSDSTGAPVAGADVRLLGAGLSTITDSSGRFEFQTLASGSYIVRARLHGLAPATYVMQIADEDHRGIGLKMYGLPRRTGARDTVSASGYGFTDAGFDAFDRRERGASRGPLLGPGDLFRADRSPLDVVLQQYRDMFTSRARRTSASDSNDMLGGDCLLLDGRRAVYQPLRGFNSLDVQLVEIFRANTLADSYLVSQMDLMPECRGDMEHHPAYFVLWTRSLR